MRRRKIVSVHIRVHETTARWLLKNRLYQLETYDEVIKRLINSYTEKKGAGGHDDE